MMDFPNTAHDITTEWLTAILRESAGRANFAITSIDIELFAIDAGLTSQLARIELQYDSSAPYLPQSLIGKFPHPNPERRKMVDVMGIPEREVRFYKEIAPHIAMRTPRVYFRDYDYENGNFLVLMEDLNPWRLLQGERLTFDIARILIEQLAQFHARWWNSLQVAEMDWLPMSDYSSWADTFAQRISTVKNNYAEKVSGDFAQIAEQLVAMLPAYMARETSRQMTIMHGDFRPTNIFMTKTEDDPEFIVIDWGGALRGSGTWDVAYFMLRGLTKDDRPNWETRLLQQYHTTLVDSGITDYALDGFEINYRWEVLAGFARAILAASVLDPVQRPELVDLYIGEYLPRYEAAFTDLKLDELARQKNALRHA